MKFFIDVQLPGSLMRWFKKHGYDAVHALDEGFGKTDDREIWDAALDEIKIGS
ncbi:DUF5615 family PIN-like protein [Verrucomicrobiales bacterium]|nr:DUF5615 family PIN-like protein [Verrucomicrobiales bacterium]